MNKAWLKIKQAWEENPLMVIGIAAVAATAGAKLIDATSNYKGRRTWEREVDRRIRQSN
jgi:hypothetical protein